MLCKVIKISSYLYRLSFFIVLLCSAHGAILRVVRENVSAVSAAAVLCFVNIKKRFGTQLCMTNSAKPVFCRLRIAAARADFKPFHIFGAKTEMLQNIFS